MDTNVSKHNIDDIKEGDSIVFEHTITAEHVDEYAKLTGDVSPLHVNPEFAHERGYPGRVVHGMLVSGLFSRVIGVHLPGENALLQSANVKFHSPVFSGDPLEIYAEVTQVSAGTGVIIIKSIITSKKTGEKVASAKIQVGFTKSDN